MIRVKLDYDRRFSRPNTWMWVDGEIPTIRCRIRVGSEEISPVDVPLRHRGSLDRVTRHFCRPIDGETFLVAHGRFHDDLPVIELLLVGTPSAIAEALIAM